MLTTHNIHVTVHLPREVYKHFVKKFIYHSSQHGPGSMVKQQTMNHFCSKEIKAWFNRHFLVDDKGNQGIVEFDDPRYPDLPILSEEYIHLQGKQPGSTQWVRIRVSSDDYHYILAMEPYDKFVTGEIILKLILIHLYVENKDLYG